MKFLKLKNYFNLIFIIIVILGIFLRFFQLGKESFWFDELFAYQIAFYKPWDILTGKIADVGNPPLFLYVLSIWQKYIKLNEFSARLPAVFFSILTIPIIYFCAKALSKKNKIFHYFSTAFFSVSLFSIHYAQEARYYSLFIFLSALSIYLQISTILHEEKNKQWQFLMFYFIVSFLGFYTHYLYFYLFFLQIILWFIFAPFKKNHSFFIFIMIGSFITLFSYYFLWGSSNLFPAIVNPKRGYSIFERVGYPSMTLDRPKILLNQIYFFAFNNLYYYFPSSFYKLLDILFSLIFVFPLILVMFKKNFKKKSKTILLYLEIPILTTFIMIVATPFGNLINNVYYYLFLLPFIILLFSYLLSLMPFKFLKFLLFFVFIFCSLTSSYKYLKNTHKTQFKEAAFYIQKKEKLVNNIYVPACDVAYVLSYYVDSLNGDFSGTCNLNDFSDINDINLIIKRPWDKLELSLNEYKQKEFFNISIYEKD